MPRVVPQASFRLSDNPGANRVVVHYAGSWECITYFCEELTLTGVDMKPAHKVVWMLLGILLVVAADVRPAFAQQGSKPNILFLLNGRRSPNPEKDFGPFRQVQRMGNLLVSGDCY